MMTHKEIADVIIAHGQGKKLQWRHESTITWQENYGNNSLEALLSDISKGLLYRPAPEPKLRPWKPEEGVGKIVRSKKQPGWIRTIVGRSDISKRFVLANPDFEVDSEDVLKYYEQLDGKPCGVEDAQ